MNLLNPWEAFAQNHAREERLMATIIAVVDDLGIFVGLERGVDGIVHLTDIDWVASGETAIKRYAVGDAIEVVILSIEVEKQRVSLGIKQRTKDPRPRWPGDGPAAVEIEPKYPKPPKPLSEATEP